METADGELLDLSGLCAGEGYTFPPEPTPLTPDHLPAHNNPYAPNADAFDPFALREPETDSGISGFDGISAQVRSAECGDLLASLNRHMTASEQLGMREDEVGLEAVVALLQRSNQEIQQLALSDPQLVVWQRQLQQEYQVGIALMQEFEGIMEQLAQEMTESFVEGFAEGFGVEMPESLDWGEANWGEGDWGEGDWGEGDLSVTASGFEAADWPLMAQIQTYCTSAEGSL
jgi:hypothetical protein